ncbi:MAG: response regulator [Candidatus Marinimicrobia bacterium]|nr:response regulator [Candidatus Neomarinimicrobiota bacterium]
MAEGLKPAPETEIILIVEGDRVVQKTLTLQFQEKGWAVHSTGEAHEALRIAQQVQPLVTLIDLTTPGIDGIALAGELIANKPELIIILLTGFPQPHLDTAGLHEVAYTYLVKPVRFEQLSMVISRARRELEVMHRNQDLQQQVTELRARVQQLEEPGAAGVGGEELDEQLPVSSQLPRGGAVGGNRPEISAIDSYARQMQPGGIVTGTPQETATQQADSGKAEQEDERPSGFLVELDNDLTQKD